MAMENKRLRAAPEPPRPPVCGVRREAGAFLISESRQKPALEERGPGLAALTAEFAKAFPDLLLDKAFLEDMETRLADVPAFAVLGIRVDGLEEGDEPALAARALAQAAKAVEGLVRSDQGFLGALSRGFLAAVFPDFDEVAAKEAATAFQEAARIGGAGTVSVGVTLFPTLDYSVSDIILNSEKALDHAAFFGPEQVVVFDSLSLNVSGDQRYQAGDLDGAVAEYERGLKMNEADVNLLNSLGVCYGDKQEFARAEAHFEAARKLTPNDVMPVYNLGLSRVLQKDLKGALARFDEALALEPGLYVALVQAGKAAMELTRFDPAIDYLTRAVETRPKGWAAHKNLGDAFVQAGRLEEASKAYEKAVRLNPEDAESLSRLADAYVELAQNLDIARSFARQAAELAPGDGEIRRRLARVLQAGGKDKEALGEFEKARELGADCKKEIRLLKKAAEKEAG